MLSLDPEKKYKKRIDALLLQYPYTFYVCKSKTPGLTLSIIDEIPSTVRTQIQQELNNLHLPFPINVAPMPQEPTIEVYPIDPFLGASMIELSHPLSPTAPVWPGGIFEIETNLDHKPFCVQTYHFSAGLGTHIDIPAHIAQNGTDLAAIDLKKLCAPCSIFVAPIGTDHTFVLTTAMIKDHENRFGPIARHSWFLVMTGWGKKANDPQAYQNSDANETMHFPKISSEAADYLVKKKILGLGIDTLSPDGDDFTFPVHKKLLTTGIFIVENIVYHSHACSNRCFLWVIPLAITGGTESPARVLLFKHES